MSLLSCLFKKPAPPPKKGPPVLVLPASAPIMQSLARTVNLEKAIVRDVRCSVNEYGQCDVEIRLVAYEPMPFERAQS